MILAPRPARIEHHALEHRQYIAALLNATIARAFRRPYTAPSEGVAAQDRNRGLECACDGSASPKIGKGGRYGPPVDYNSCTSASGCGFAEGHVT
jgi:hypothetical protein